MRRKSLYFLLIVSIAWSCTRTDPEPVSDNKFLVSVEPIDYLAVWQVQIALLYLDFEDFSSSIKTDAQIYKMVYNTTYNGEAIQASGLIGIPVENDVPLPIISVYHGTLVKHADAPSVASGDYLLLTALATTGAITLVPDFSGFGSSTNVLHPYFVEEGEAVPAVDMILATQELMEDSAIVWNSKLLLTGYSEGGYVTLATHKYLQEHKELGLEVTASAAGSGAYDQVHMKNYFFELENYDQPFYLAYAIYASQKYDNVEEPLEIFFQQPYADKIPSLFDGSKGSAEINSELTTHVPSLLQPEFLENSETNPVFARFEAQIRDNSLTNWTPQAPVRFYHGGADVTVPKENSEATLAQLIKNGATEEISLTILENETHTSAFVPMFREVALWFTEIKD